MLERGDLPFVNACLNSAAFLLLCSGYAAIKSGREALHKRLMLTASAVSAAFLTSYLSHHAMFGSTKFTGQGWIRPAYLSVLLTHVLLAAALLPLVLITLYHAFKGEPNRSKHRRIARWTFPIWVYVSITGVLIYVVLYQLYPPVS